MSTKRKILPALAIPGMFAVGALAASAAGAGAGARPTDQTTGAALIGASADRSGSQLLSNTTVADPSASPKPATSGDPNAGPHHGHGPGFRGGALHALVTDGTITADQRTKIVAAFEATESKETAEQEAAEHADRAAWVSGVLDPLVTDGTLTADQAAKVQAALEAMRPGWGPGGPGWGGDRGGHGHFGPGDGVNGRSPDASPAPSDAPAEGSSSNG